MNENVVFDGPASVTFGVQAVRLSFTDGDISAIDPFAAGSGAVRGLEPTPNGAPNIITIEGRRAEVS
jgi:hypothetical protein